MKEDLELKECTFAPKVSSTSNNSNNKMMNMNVNLPSENMNYNSNYNGISPCNRSDKSGFGSENDISQSEAMSISRANLLYQRTQAFQAQSEYRLREKQIVKAEKELAACTFKPSINKYTANRYLPCHIKGFTQHCKRSKAGFQKKMEEKAIRESVPRGENYEYMRTRPIQPFNLSKGNFKRS